MFEVTAQLKVRDGELAGFTKRAAEMMQRTREQDTKTRRYDWYLCDDGVRSEVRETYVDPDGLLEHNLHVREARDLLFRDHGYGHEMTIFGEPSPALADLMVRMTDHVAFNRFSFLQGLDSQPTALVERRIEGDKTMFEATARLKIRAGQLDGFKQQVAEIVRQMKAQDEQPLRYDWFLNESGTECEVREAYPDADTLLRHQQAIAEAKMKLFREFLDGHTMTFYGELSPALAGALQKMGTEYSTFSFMQGLNADVREEVTA